MKFNANIWNYDLIIVIGTRCDHLVQETSSIISHGLMSRIYMNYSNDRNLGQ